MQVDILIGHALLWGMLYNFESYMFARKSGYTSLAFSRQKAEMQDGVEVCYVLWTWKLASSHENWSLAFGVLTEK